MSSTTRRGVVALLLLAACEGGVGTTLPNGSDPTNGADASARDGGRDDDAGASCTPGMPSTFVPSVSWQLPAPRCSKTFDAFSSVEQGTGFSHVLLDVTADSAPEIVVTSDACDDDVGRSHWDVYDNTLAGFALQPTSFTLPASRCNVAFDRVARADGAVSYAVTDLDGDRFPDLVVTRDQCDPDIGVQRWDVYRGSKAGFAAAPSSWKLPAPSCGGKFGEIAKSTDPMQYTLVDMDGDRRAELVIFAASCDPDIGRKSWIVHSNDGNGFGAPTDFGLPAVRCNDDWRAVAKSGTVVYQLLDLDADRRPDLVVTRDNCDSDIGAKHWDVYPNTPGSFGTSHPFTLPATRCSTRFDAMSKADGALTFSLLDFSCDERPDLVVTRDNCDGDLGTKQWDVYEAEASGFRPTPSTLNLPASRCASRWDALASGGATSKVDYGTTALDGDKVGLVVARDECDSEIGKTSWDFYRAAGAARSR